MSAIGTTEGAGHAQVSVEIATQVLKLANQQQAQVLELLESAVEGSTQAASEPGKGEHLDAHG